MSFGAHCDSIRFQYANDVYRDGQNRQPNLLRCKHTPLLTPKANLNSMREGFSLCLSVLLEIERRLARLPMYAIIRTTTGRNLSLRVQLYQ
jgi:hypothetical protein